MKKEKPLKYQKHKWSTWFSYGFLVNRMLRLRKYWKNIAHSSNKKKWLETKAKLSRLNLRIKINLQ